MQIPPPHSHTHTCGLLGSGLAPACPAPALSPHPRALTSLVSLPMVLWGCGLPCCESINLTLWVQVYVWGLRLPGLCECGGWRGWGQAPFSPKAWDTAIENCLWLMVLLFLTHKHSSYLCF